MFSHIIGEGYGIFPPTGTCLCTVSLLLFKVERDNAYSCSIFFMLGSICRYAIHHQKAARRFLRFRFWKARKQVLSAQPDQFEPFLLLLWTLLSQPAFKFAALLIMNKVMMSLHSARWTPLRRVCDQSGAECDFVSILSRCKRTRDEMRNPARAIFLSLTCNQLFFNSDQV